jgi:hypothetical protein
MPASTFSEVLEKLKHIVEEHMNYMDFLTFVLSDQTIYSCGYVFDFSGAMRGLSDVIRNMYFSETWVSTYETLNVLLEEWKRYIFDLTEEDFIFNNGTAYPTKIFKWEEVYYGLRQESKDEG